MYRIIEEPSERKVLSGTITLDNGVVDYITELSEEQLTVAMADTKVKAIMSNVPEIGPDPIGRVRQKEVKTPRLDENGDPVTVKRSIPKLDANGDTELDEFDNIVTELIDEPVIDITSEDDLDANGDQQFDGIGDPIELFPDTVLKNTLGRKVIKATYNGWRHMGVKPKPPVVSDGPGI